ncbi:MAG TPA: NAD(P)-binding domain-containing protein [Candidatus Thermoplasmatota archaeon]|nr:NAD(P)-binding domain-containing protein [Candidatus Thermoplasmatota archaeon]
MRIGILGSGGVAQNLGSGFLAKGHDVVVGTRDPKATLAKSKPDAMGTPPLSAWAKANPKARVGTFAEAARHGEVVVFCVHGANVAEAVNAAGPDNLAGKLVLDTTNPLEFGPNGAHKPKSIPDSCLQVAQRAAPKANFVKAWNCTPGHSMVDPKHPGGGDQLICGDDPQAKAKAAGILKEFGWGVADVGDASMAPYVEGTALAVINYAAKTNDWGWIVKLNGRKA